MSSGRCWSRDRDRDRTKTIAFAPIKPVCRLPCFINTVRWVVTNEMANANLPARACVSRRRSPRPCSHVCHVCTRLRTDCAPGPLDRVQQMKRAGGLGGAPSVSRSQSAARALPNQLSTHARHWHFTAETNDVRSPPSVRTRSISAFLAAFLLLFSC